MDGSKSLELNCLAIKIWDWSIQGDNWISAVHLAGKVNVRADAQSRNFADKHEWTLRMVPTIVIADTFCASPDTQISYR